MILMADVIPISEAKANLSKLVKRAHAGETIYLGAYGRAEAVIGPVPEGRTVRIGVLKGQRIEGFDLASEAFVGSDPDIVALFDESIARDPS